MGIDIELHIFTNSTRYAPDTRIIRKTHDSFNKVFGSVQSTSIWHDPKPNTQSAEAYHSELKDAFPVVRRTSSLADGYKKAVLGSTARFLVMLEHDWEFLGENIGHGLGDICELMGNENLLHLRFNKNQNKPVAWDAELIEVNRGLMPYCVTPCLSNNPHIIQREMYLEDAIDYLRVSRGGKSGGIEDRLLKAKGLYGAIYGPEGHPPTVAHLDGRSNEARMGPLTALRNKLDFRNTMNVRFARRKMRQYPGLTE